ncbi:hypothetical protein AFCA_012042 [Aspergillus flavus]|nr:hypothetical protein AFCA_012042 [Aspergillus flavus]
MVSGCTALCISRLSVNPPNFPPQLLDDIGVFANRPLAARGGDCRILKFRALHIAATFENVWEALHIFPCLECFYLSFDGGTSEPAEDAPAYVHSGENGVLPTVVSRLASACFKPLFFKGNREDSGAALNKELDDGLKAVTGPSRPEHCASLIVRDVHAFSHETVQTVLFSTDDINLSFYVPQCLFLQFEVALKFRSRFIYGVRFTVVGI